MRDSKAAHSIRYAERSARSRRQRLM